MPRAVPLHTLADEQKFRVESNRLQICRQLTPDVIAWISALKVCSATISAAERSGSWDVLKKLLSDIKHCQVESNVVLFNAAISAAEKVCGTWVPAGREVMAPHTSLVGRGGFMLSSEELTV
eukprot:Skav224376  [mRNA]  locus=scaffold1155:32235:34071:+ [translate_table: standard]